MGAENDLEGLGWKERTKADLGISFVSIVRLTFTMKVSTVLLSNACLVAQVAAYHQTNVIHPSEPPENTS
jgi:hypothetical protein